eukprot:11125_1
MDKDLLLQRSDRINDGFAKLKTIDIHDKYLVSGYITNQQKLFQDQNNAYYNLQSVTVLILTYASGAVRNPVKVGYKVNLKGGQTGQVKYIGQPKLAEGILIGIELNYLSPNAGDGNIFGEQAFLTKRGKGYFMTRKHFVNITKPVVTEGAHAVLTDLVR